jgi:hypothetical protein
MRFEGAAYRVGRRPVLVRMADLILCGLCSAVIADDGAGRTRSSGGGCAFLCRTRTRQPATRIRLLPPEQDVKVTAPSAWDVRRPAHDSSGLGVKDGLQRTIRLNRCRRRSLVTRTDGRVARVGPTTPTRARRPFDASVDVTDARHAAAHHGRGRASPRPLVPTFGPPSPCGPAQGWPLRRWEE